MSADQPTAYKASQLLLISPLLSVRYQVLKFLFNGDIMKAIYHFHEHKLNQGHETRTIAVLAAL